MFLDREIKILSMLIDKSTSADDILNETEMNAVKKTTNINRIRDQLIVPGHGKSKKTLTIIKVFTSSFNLQKFISQVMDSLQRPYELRIGCSFIMLHSTTPSYVYAIPARALNNKFRMIRSNSDEQKLLDFLKTSSYNDLLSFAFHQRNTTNPFERSGYRPEKLVCLSVWVTKYKTLD